MKRKKLVVSILVGAAVAGAAIYFLGTSNGKKEAARLKKTGSAIAGVFKTLGKEVARNVKQARKEERIKALKAFVRDAVAA
jgi:gas vesicle protein